MKDSKIISRLLGALKVRLDEFCNESEADFQRNFEIFQLSNFQIGKGSLIEKPYKLDLGNREIQILDNGQTLIIQPVSVEFKIYASSEAEDSGISLLEDEFRDRLDTAIIHWSLHSSLLSKPITNKDIDGNSDRKSIGVGHGTYSMAIRREFNLVALAPSSNRTTAVLEQLMQEIEKTPQEYLPNLLQSVRLLRQSVIVKPTETNFCQEWQETRTGETLQISQLREGIHKNYVLDENHQPIAVQIPIAEFERIEEIIEDFGLARLMQEAEDEDNERLSKDEALKYYQALKGKNVDS